jgi:hypothetical protein
MPLSEIKIFYKELNNRQFLALSKINLILPLNEETAVDYATIFREIVLESIKNKEDFLKLNIIDYILFLAKLREVTIGEDLELYVKEANVSDMPVKFNLKISSFIQRLYSLAKECLPNNNLTFDNFNVEIDWPNLQEEEFFLKKIPQDSLSLADKVISSIPYFIKKITFDSNCINLINLNFEERTQIYNKLPFSIRQNIQSLIIEAVLKLKNGDVWNVKHLQEFSNGIDLYSISYQGILRLFFSDDISGILEEYYMLASKGVVPFYLDSISVAERKVYMTLFAKELEALNPKGNKGGEDFESLR